jgi:hypothetical protein
MMGKDERRMSQITALWGRVKARFALKRILIRVLISTLVAAIILVIAFFGEK